MGFTSLSYLISVICTMKVTSHSWLACTDYAEKNAHYYDPNKCRGFPRAANMYLGDDIAFGEESGYDHEPKENQPCQVSRNDGLHYDSSYPMAVYYPGQQVVLAHPMKGHGADADCTNPHIPDSGSWIFRGQVNARGDPSFSEYRRNLVFDLGASPIKNKILSQIYPKSGFQNAPAFCLNQDKSLGTYSFNVPVGLKPGRYSFMWVWAFNNLQDLFTTCFEVQIVQNRDLKNRLLRERGYTDISEPCGGMTSNPKVRGVCNGDGTGAGYNSRGPRGSALKSNSNLWLSVISITATLIQSNAR